jgi:hypothetical protein
MTEQRLSYGNLPLSLMLGLSKGYEKQDFFFCLSLYLIVSVRIPENMREHPQRVMIAIGNVRVSSGVPIRQMSATSDVIYRFFAGASRRA